MPLTLNQLKAKMRQNPEKFREDQQKLMDFSKTLYKGALQNERIAARPLSMRFGVVMAAKSAWTVEKLTVQAHINWRCPVFATPGVDIILFLLMPSPKQTAEERDFQKFRETNKTADELLKTLYPTFDIKAYPTGTSPCTYAIEPPCTERYARWCGRSVTQLLGDLLPDCK